MKKVYWEIYCSEIIYVPTVKGFLGTTFWHFEVKVI